MQISKKTSLYYDDVNLLAQPCKIKSRKEIPLELKRIIVSPMTSISGKTLLNKAAEIGLTVCVHRFQDVKDQLLSAKDILNYENLFFSVGLNDENRIQELVENGVKNWLIDIANGYMHEEIEKTLRYLICTKSSRTSLGGAKKRFIVGNIHSKEGFKNLDFGVDYSKVGIRVGIGNGNHCLTKNVTGYNRGQITELKECYKERITSQWQPFIIADGGIKSSGEAVKAFGVGADYIMIGSFFGCAEEAECHVQGHKKLFGGASKFQAELLNKTISHTEGRESEFIGEIKPLKVLIEEFWGGISSGISYSGYTTLTDMIGNGVFELKL